MDWYKIENNRGGGADVYLFDEIGIWGISAKRFIDQIKDIKGTITLRINSPGGSVFEGLAIYNVLRNLDVEVVVEGLAASMASVIAMSGKSIKMAKNSMMMIHNPISSVCGDSEEMRKTADLLDKLKSQLVNTYSTFSGMSTERISELMSKETWFTAEEAKSYGLCTEVVEAVQITNKYRSDYFSEKEEYKKFVEMQSMPLMANKKEENMQDLYKILGVKNGEEAIVKIDRLLAMEQENKALKSANNEAKLNQAVAEGIITPRQKGFAEILLKHDESLLDEYIQNARKQPQKMTKETKIIVGDTEEITWDMLMKNPAKAEEIYRDNQALYEELKNQWMEGNR